MFRFFKRCVCVERAINPFLHCNCYLFPGMFCSDQHDGFLITTDPEHWKTRAKRARSLKHRTWERPLDTRQRIEIGHTHTSYKRQASSLKTRPYIQRWAEIHLYKYFVTNYKYLNKVLEQLFLLSWNNIQWGISESKYFSTYQNRFFHSFVLFH